MKYKNSIELASYMCDIKEKEIKILIIKWDIRKTSILGLGSNHKEKVGECNIFKFEYVINERKKTKKTTKSIYGLYWRSIQKDFAFIEYPLIWQNINIVPSLLAMYLILRKNQIKAIMEHNEEDTQLGLGKQYV